MKNKIISYLNKTHGFKTARRGIVLALTLALLSYNFGSGVLQSLGATGTDAPTCGLEDHVHTHDCYASVLACDHTEGPDGSAPIHDGTCYISQTICGMQEHVHTDECYTEAVENTVSGSDAQKPLSLVSISNDILALETSEPKEVEIDNTKYFTNTLYIKTTNSGSEAVSYQKWADNPTVTSQLEIGDEFAIMAVMAADDLVLYEAGTDNVRWPNTNECGFKSDDITITNPSNTRYTPDRDETIYWKLEATCQTLRVGSGFKVNLINNNKEAVDSSPAIKVDAVDAINETIFVKTAYGPVNKDTATNMLTGEWKANNSQYNYYPLYVGETLEIAAQEGSRGQSWTIDKIEGSELEPSLTTYEDTTTSYFATTPGKYKITLNGSANSPLSTFYFKVIYPIYVNTAVGEIHKDKVHEYVYTALNYNEAPDVYLTDNEGNPLYVKNAGKDPGKYIMYVDDTIELTAYYAASDSQTPDFDVPGSTNLSKGETLRDDADSINNVAFKKATATFTAMSSGDVSITFGNETFYIYVRSNDNPATVNHFDIEIADRGTEEGEIITRRADGSVESVTIIYNAFVSGVNNCKIYNNEGKTIGELGSDEYWERGTPGTPQYELTSAYWTNGEVLTDEDKKPLPEGQWIVRSRNIPMSNVESVVFDIEILLKPLNDSSNAKDITIPSVTVPMTPRQILDALNKCPNHSGLDFTIQSNFSFASVEPMAKKILNGSDLTQGRFKFGLYDSDDNLISEATNKQNGDVIFDALYFSNSNDDASKTYDYYIKEIDDQQTGVQYDTNIYRMRVSFAPNQTSGVNIPVVSYDFLDGDEWRPYTGTIPEFTNTYTAPTPDEVEFNAHKTLVNTSGSPLDLTQWQFTFGLWTTSDLSLEPSETFNNDKYGNVSFGKFKYTSEDFDKSNKYVYYIKEMTGDVKNIEFDTTIYRITVNLEENLDEGKIVANATYAYSQDGGNRYIPYPGGNTLQFVNKNMATTTPPPPELEVPTVHKTLTNANGYRLNLKQGQFSFGLYTNLSGEPVDTARNDQNGYVSFDIDKLNITSDDLGQSNEKDFYYYIKEINDKQTGIKYDTTIYRMTVSLKKNPSTGTITSTVKYAYSKNGGNSWSTYTGSTPEFVNIDTTAPVDVTVEKVWDDNNSKDRPESVVIQLLKGDNTVYGEVTLSKSNKWQYTWESLDGAVEWSVQEVNIPDGYTAKYDKNTKNGLHFTVTNMAALPQTGQLNWPIPVLFGCGLILITLGSIWERSGGKKKPDEN